MTKTEEVIKALQEGKDTKTIKEETKASEALISKCRSKIEAMKKQDAVEDEQEEDVTDEEIDAVIQKIVITPDKKYLTSDKDGKKEEDYHCTGCNHNWKATEIPAKCPNCGCEF